MDAYYFGTEDRKLTHGDGRVVRIGETHTVDGEIVPCENGLHGSVRAIDALRYARGPIAYKVRLSGVIVPHDGDKHAASERTYLKGADATDTLFRFARLCALDVVHLWHAPNVVVRYLRTGDESLRAAARDAAWAAARDKQNRRLSQMLAALWREEG